MLTHLLQRAVSHAARQPRRVVALALALMLAAGGFAATHFDMSTDTGALISSKTKWRQTEDIVAKAFPEANKGIAVVIDGRTPEAAEDAATRLAAALIEDKANFVRAGRPDGGEFFDRSGLLFGSLDEVKQTTAKLIEAQPLLGSLAVDPTLRGIGKARILSQRTMKNIRQNLFFAFIYNFLGVPVAAGILFPWFGLLLSPMLASAAMSFSSVSVIGNALRLRNADL